MKSLPRVFGAAALLIVIYLTYAILLEPAVDAIILAKFGGHETAAADTFKDVVGNISLYLYVLPFI